jgi:hypothetical protein
MGRVPSLLVLLCLAWLAQPPGALAQSARRGTAYTPSRSGPSKRIGIVGGSFTRYSPQVLDIRTGAPNAGLPSFSMATRPTRHSRQGQSIAPLKLGMVASPGSAGLFREGLLSESQIGTASGFYASVSPSTPLYGWPGLNILPGEETPIEASKPEGSAYHRFFDLTPVRPAASSAPLSFASSVDEAEKRNDDRLRELYKEAFSMFSEATAGQTGSSDALTKDQRTLALRRAGRLLGAARDLTKTGQSPSSAAPDELPILDVLEAHAHLECGRSSGLFAGQALNCLMQAARDDPDTFYRLAQARRNAGDERPIAAYFGDYRDGRSSLLERQMLQYLRVATVEKPTVDSLVLQAYCAWMLDDSNRAARALDEAENALRECTADRRSENWSGLIAALRYAL